MSPVVDGIRSLRLDALEGANHWPDPVAVSQRIAEALGWTTGAASVRRVSGEASPVQMLRGFVGAQSAAVFAVTESAAPSLLHDTALYAYHASIPWGVIADQSGAVVFNSHWVRDEDWFRLPPIAWDRLEDHSDILEALTPPGVTEGRIERAATQAFKPDRFLRPVDDALVERLDHWRAEALRHSRKVAEVDEKLQTLFAQFFVLRTVEDRQLAPALHPLLSVLGKSGEASREKLHTIFEAARALVGSELFDTDTIEGIPDFILGGIIGDLYVPRQLPLGNYRYNFSWIDADVLGLAYEKYLSTVLMPVAVGAQLGFFQQPMRDVERVSVRKAGGVYYTPGYLVKYLADECLADLIGPDLDPENIPRIADFACGSGSFLVAAADVLIRRLRQIDPNRNWARELVTGKHLIGVDVDEKAVTMARLNLWTRFAQEPQPLPLPRLEEVVVHGDSLGAEVWQRVPEKYDVVLGNPPFLALGQTPDREELAARFRTAQGRFDYSYLFVELAVSHLKPSGELGMVVPNRLFRNRDAGTLREILTGETSLRTIVDFGSNEVFEGTSAYIGTIVTAKRANEAEAPPQRVRVIAVNDVAPRFLGALLSRASEPGAELRNDSLVAYDAPHPHGAAPWLLLSDSAKLARSTLEELSVPLGEVAAIFQGIRTGANDIFIVQIESSEGTLARVVNGLGESGIVEAALLRPAIFGSDIQKYDLVKPTRFLLYPYKSGVVIPETELREQFPRALEYFGAYRDLLSGRGSIKAGGLRWYELVRKRDEAWLTQPKLLIRDLATETSFAADQSGGTFLIGGTAVVPAEAEMLLPLMAYLNSRLITGFLAEITPSFRGGFQKFEPQHLQKVPVLRDVMSPGATADALGALAGRILVANAENDASAREQAEAEVEALLARILSAAQG